MDKFRCVLLSLIQLMGICCNVSAREVPYGEAVYLHLDNDGYFLGETLHFAANVVNTADCKAEVKSRVLYVDFVAPEGYVLSTGKYRIDDGRCDGEIALPPLWLSGLYEIRAYTRYMMKADSRDYFTRVVPVYDTSHGGDYSLRGILSRRREVHSDSASTVQPLLRTATETEMSDINVRGNYPYSEPAIVICLMPMNGDKARGVASCLALDYVYTRVAGFADGSKHEVPDYCRIREPEQGGDNRRLLYWNPTVTLDERGEATVEFRNNSSCRQVVVSAEGLTNDGRAVTNR